MKIISQFTKSHKIFVDNFFLPTFPFESGVSLILEQIPQVCLTGEYYHDGWTTAMKEKIKSLLKSLPSVNNDILLFADVDIVFYGNIRDEISDLVKHFDLVYQQDNKCGDRICAGFFACKNDDLIRQIFHEIIRDIKQYCDDQIALNAIVKKMGISTCSLPRTYFSYGVLDSKVWNGEENFDVPEKLKMHHGNWTVGINNKIKLLNVVKKITLKK